MVESEKNDETKLVPINAENNIQIWDQKDKLKDESNAIIAQIIEEKDKQKTNELIAMFNDNQRKKTLTRVNKLNDLLDVITDQAITRYTKRPDEIPTAEIIQGLKVVQDITERSQKQVNTVEDAPLIQINQQTNDINLGDTDNLSKDSRDRIKNAVAGLLSNIAANTAANQNEGDS